jgi:hypothetical protein
MYWWYHHSHPYIPGTHLQVLKHQFEEASQGKRSLVALGGIPGGCEGVSAQLKAISSTGHVDLCETVLLNFITRHIPQLRSTLKAEVAVCHMAVAHFKYLCSQNNLNHTRYHVLITCKFSRSRGILSTHADCGAGVGRVTKELLLHHFTEVDLLEPSQHLLETAGMWEEKSLMASVTRIGD